MYHIIYRKAQQQGIKCKEKDVKNALKSTFGDPKSLTNTEGSNVNLKS